MSHTHGCVVVPCYNEERRLDLAQLADFIRRQSAIDLLLVNDGSRDQTGALLARLQAEFPRRVRLLPLTPNRGKAEAVRRGLLAALEARPKFVGYLDADLAAPCSAVERLSEVLDRCPEIDIALGIRLPLLGHSIERTVLRNQTGRLASALCAATLGVSIRDTQCGAKVFRTTPGLERALAEPFCVNWMFDVELLARCIAALPEAVSPSRAIYELPLDRWHDVQGSKLRWIDGPRSVLELARLWRRYRWGGARRATRAVQPQEAPSRRRAA